MKKFGIYKQMAAALAVVLTVLTTLIIYIYRRVTHTSELEGLY